MSTTISSTWLKVTSLANDPAETPGNEGAEKRVYVAELAALLP